MSCPRVCDPFWAITHRHQCGDGGSALSLSHPEAGREQSLPWKVCSEATVWPQSVQPLGTCDKGHAEDDAGMPLLDSPIMLANYSVSFWLVFLLVAKGSFRIDSPINHRNNENWWPKILYLVSATNFIPFCCNIAGSVRANIYGKHVPDTNLRVMACFNPQTTWCGVYYYWLHLQMRKLRHTEGK